MIKYYCALLLSIGGGTSASDITINVDGSLNPTTSSLERARKLTVPLASDVENAEYEHSTFWDENGLLLHDAWEEWESISLDTLPNENQLMDPELSTAVDNAFANPSPETESKVHSLWSNSYTDEMDEIQPLPKGVYATNLLTPAGISNLRTLLDQASTSGIPKRRPNGMNRNGLILDRAVNGAVPISPLMDYLEKEIIDRIVRPVGRMLFKEFVGCNDDLEYFAFTIRYDGSDEKNQTFSPRDVKLNEHRDASVITMNVNLNLPEEGYDGSNVYFREFPGGQSNEEKVSVENTTSLVRFTPGMAIIHLGAHRHGSVPISPTVNNDSGGRSAMRYNLVIWLFGKDGDVRIAPYLEAEQMNVVERWHGCDSVRGMMSNVINFA